MLVRRLNNGRKKQRHNRYAALVMQWSQATDACYLECICYRWRYRLPVPNLHTDIYRRFTGFDTPMKTVSLAFTSYTLASLILAIVVVAVVCLKCAISTVKHIEHNVLHSIVLHHLNIYFG